MKRSRKVLRWGYSTGACAAAAATAAWKRLTLGQTPKSIRLLFLDGRTRELPLTPYAGHMAAVQKDGGDDPDCTHGAIVYADLRPCLPGEAGSKDYVLAVGKGTVIVRGVEGIGLCTRSGLDCEQGRWAVNVGPRRMIAENLQLAGLDTGCWLLEIGIPAGEILAKRTLNARLGITGGISILGTTGLVRPYSHEAYRDTIQICVKSHYLSGGTVTVLCTGGRTRSGAVGRLPELPESAFVCIGDFIAESLAAACRYSMREIIVACMPGKLCKYAAGFANTHAHQVSQDMGLLCTEVRRILPAEKALHSALEGSVSVREALLSIPAAARPELLRRLARSALEQFARRCPGGPALRLLVFNFDGEFLFEEGRGASAVSGASGRAEGVCPEVVSSCEPASADRHGVAQRRAEAIAGAGKEQAEPVSADPCRIVGPLYFMQRS